MRQKWKRQLSRPIFPVGAKNGLWGRDYHFRFQDFAPLWYDTTSDHYGNIQAYSTGVAFNFTSCL